MKMDFVTPANSIEVSLCVFDEEKDSIYHKERLMNNVTWKFEVEANDSRIKSISTEILTKTVPLCFEYLNVETGACKEEIVNIDLSNAEIEIEWNDNSMSLQSITITLHKKGSHYYQNDPATVKF